MGDRHHHQSDKTGYDRKPPLEYAAERAGCHQTSRQDPEVLRELQPISG